MKGGVIKDFGDTRPAQAHLGCPRPSPGPGGNNERPAGGGWVGEGLSNKACPGFEGRSWRWGRLASGKRLSLLQVGARSGCGARLGPSLPGCAPSSGADDPRSTFYGGKRRTPPGPLPLQNGPGPGRVAGGGPAPPAGCQVPTLAPLCPSIFGDWSGPELGSSWLSASDPGAPLSPTSRAVYLGFPNSEPCASGEPT